MKTQRKKLMCEVGNIEWMDGLVDVNVACNIDGDIVSEWSGNVDVEVQIVSHEFNKSCSSETFDNMFDVNVEGGNERGLSDDRWKYEELVSGPDNDEEVNDVEGCGTFTTFIMSKSMVELFGEKRDILDTIKSCVG